MNASSLMSRAKKLLQSRAGAAAAMMIVPLATAVPGRADSVEFTIPIGGSSVIGGNAGAFASETPAFSGGVHLSGGVDAAAQSGGVNLLFTWSGGFTGGTDVNVGDTFWAAFTDDIERIPGDGELIFGSGGINVNWGLDISVFDSSDTELAGLHVSDSGFGTSSGPPSPPIFVLGGQADHWVATLQVNWDDTLGYTGDQLTVDPSIDLSITTVSAAASGVVPLPRAVWAGGALLGGLGLFQMRRRRKPAPFG